MLSTIKKIIIRDNLKNPNKSILVKKKEKHYRQSGKTFFLGAENFRPVPIYEAKSAKESTMDQELDICKKYEIATYNMRRVCVTNKKYNVNKPPYLQIYFELYFE